MSVRSIVLGLLLGLGIAGVTYFNDQVIRQSFFVGNHLPYSVFGFFVILVIFVNPLLRRFRPSLVLRPFELAVIVAMGLFSCLWPGAGFVRCFTPLVTVPTSQFASRSTWRATQALSYIPGGSGALAQGFVKDWNGFVQGLAAGATDSAGVTAQGRFWLRLPFEGRVVVESAQDPLPQDDRARLVEAVNRCLDDPALYERAAFSGLGLSQKIRDEAELLAQAARSDSDIRRVNRGLLEAAFPGIIRSSPAGSGLLLADGDASAPALVSLLQGSQGGAPGFFNLPWLAWLPTLVFWGGLALSLGVACVCLAMIVQPQWKREMLPYPIARFVQDVSEPGQNGGLPRIAASPLFWYGLGAMVVLHLVNGLFAWFPNSIGITVEFNFDGLWQALPAAFLQGSHHFFIRPHLYFTVIAFTFFLNTQVAFSAGISVVVYALFSFVLVSNGIALSSSALAPGNFTIMRVGSYLACAVMMAWVGRRYYANVAASGLWLRPRNSETPLAAAWAMRVLIASVAAFCVLLMSNSLSWDLSLLLAGALLLITLVLTRINAETGIFFSKPDFVPVMPFLALFGVQALGPTGLFVILIVSMVFAADIRENAMTFITNGLFMTTERERVLPRNSVIGASVAMIVISLIVAVAVSIFIQYTRGMPYADTYAMSSPVGMMDYFASRLTELTAYDELDNSMAVSAGNRLSSLRPDAVMLWWLLAGFAVYAGCSFMRTRFSWWPIHPVLFLVWGTFFPSQSLGFSLLVGWLMKVLTVRFAGAKGYHTLKPLMAGVIAGELLAAIGWSLVGALYFFITGQVPKVYQIFFS